MKTMQEAAFTREEYMRLPEGYPAQLIEGVLVKEPAPTYRHQLIVGGIHLAACGLVGLRRVVLSPIDLFVDDLNVLQPDVAVFAEAPPVDIAEIPVPLLVVEVLSPSTARRDRRQKSAIYLRAGVREVWLVDPAARWIEVRGAGGGTTGPGREQSSMVLPGFALRVDDLP